MSKEKNTPNPPFNIPETFVEKATKDTAVYLFQQTEKCLIETIETEKLTTDRTYRLLAILIPSTVAGIGYGLTKFLNSENDFLLFVISVTVVFLLATIITLYKLIAPKHMMLNGSLPSRLIIEDTCKLVEQHKEERQVVMFYLWEIRNFEGRITVNRKINDKRNLTFSRSLKILFWMTITDVTLITLYLLVSIYLTSC